MSSADFDTAPRHRFPVALTIFVLMVVTNVTSAVAMLFGQG